MSGESSSTTSCAGSAVHCIQRGLRPVSPSPDPPLSNRGIRPPPCRRARHAGGRPPPVALSEVNTTSGAEPDPSVACQVTRLPRRSRNLVVISSGLVPGRSVSEAPAAHADAARDRAVRQPGTANQISPTAVCRFHRARGRPRDLRKRELAHARPGPSVSHRAQHGHRRWIQPAHHIGGCRSFSSDPHVAPGSRMARRSHLATASAGPRHVQGLPVNDEVAPRCRRSVCRAPRPRATRCPAQMAAPAAHKSASVAEAGISYAMSERQRPKQGEPLGMMLRGSGSARVASAPAR